jgi:hypothetical protein
MDMVAFSSLSYKEQVNAVCENAAFLANRRVDEYLVALYQLDGFYIELFFKTGQAPLEKLECFSELERLKPYLEKINISTLLPPR